MARNEASFVAFSCTHHPLQDDSAIDFLHGVISNTEPDYVIHLGDGHEAASASRWPHEYDFSLADEIEAHNNFLKATRKCYPKAKYIFLPGNHDDNIVSINRIDPQLRGLCDYRKLESELANGHWKMPCEYVYDRYKGVFRLGQVTFAHGYESNANADEAQALTLGVPFGLFVSGHTHRPCSVTQAYKTKSLPLPYWYANTGTLRDMDNCDYMRRKRKVQWGQAIVCGGVHLGWWKGRSNIIPASPQWEAETVFLRMYDEPTKTDIVGRK